MKPEDKIPKDLGKVTRIDGRGTEIKEDKIDLEGPLTGMAEPGPTRNTKKPSIRMPTRWGTLTNASGCSDQTLEQIKEDKVFSEGGYPIAVFVMCPEEHVRSMIDAGYKTVFYILTPEQADKLKLKWFTVTPDNEDKEKYKNDKDFDPSKDFGPYLSRCAFKLGANNTVLNYVEPEKEVCGSASAAQAKAFVEVVKTRFLPSKENKNDNPDNPLAGSGGKSPIGLDNKPKIAGQNERETPAASVTSAVTPLAPATLRS